LLNEEAHCSMMTPVLVRNEVKSDKERLKQQVRPGQDLFRYRQGILRCENVLCAGERAITCPCSRQATERALKGGVYQQPGEDKCRQSSRGDTRD